MRLPIVLTNGQLSQLSTNEQLSTNPAYCRIGARAVEIAHDNDTTLNFSAEIANTAFFNSPTNRLKIPHNGIYLVSVYCQYAPNNNGYRQIRVLVNGTAQKFARHNAPAVGLSLIELFSFQSNDYLNFETVQTSGSLLNLNQFTVSILRID
jgi:hypothetical protein